MNKQIGQRLPVDRLKQFVIDLFLAAGVPQNDATTIADAMIAQEVRGNTTHGIRSVDMNLRGLVAGRIKPKPDHIFLSDHGMTAVLDGDHGVGIVGCMKGMRHAIKKAQSGAKAKEGSGGGGIGMVIVVRNNHSLAATPYTLEATKAGMIGITFSNTKGSMGYPGTNARAIGNTPIGFGIPTACGDPILYDACLTTSGGNLRQWIREGQQIPVSLQGLDPDGHPTTDPQLVLEGGTPLPIGGHKGAGLAILVEILTGVLGGAAFLSQITPRGQKDPTDKNNAVSHCCLAIDIKAFMPVSQFEARMMEFIADLKDNPLADGTDQIRIPGERMAQTKREWETNGIPLESDVQQKLTEWAQKLGVIFPA